MTAVYRATCVLVGLVLAPKALHEAILPVEDSVSASDRRWRNVPLIGLNIAAFLVIVNAWRIAESAAAQPNAPVVSAFEATLPALATVLVGVPPLATAVIGLAPTAGLRAGLSVAFLLVIASGCASWLIINREGLFTEGDDPTMGLFLLALAQVAWAARCDWRAWRRQL